MSTAELEYKLLYSMIVAGKTAAFADAATYRFCGNRRPGYSPFDVVRCYLVDRTLDRCLRLARTGNYAKLKRGFAALVRAKLDLATCTVADLERIHGIGPKTSRFFMLWTRSGARYAALDTHVLKWLRYLGHRAPYSTPQSSMRYAALESIFLAESDRRQLSPRQLDSKIWDWCSTGLHKDGEWPEKLRR